MPRSVGSCGRCVVQLSPTRLWKNRWEAYKNLLRGAQALSRGPTAISSAGISLCVSTRRPHRSVRTPGQRSTCWRRRAKGRARFDAVVTFLTFPHFSCIFCLPVRTLCTPDTPFSASFCALLQNKWSVRFLVSSL